MVHRELQQGPLIIGYGVEMGFEESVFHFSIQDSRFSKRTDLPEKHWNLLVDDYDKSGKGYYLRAYHGEFGAGRKISLKNMTELWKVYGVPEEHVAWLADPKKAEGVESVKVAVKEE